MFDNLNTLKKVASQKYDRKSGLVNPAAKAGRPPAPHMERVHIKLDKSLHSNLKLACKSHGINKSAFISLAIKEYLAKM